MLLVKFTASDLRLIKGAQTDQEKLGIRQLVLDRIEQSETLKSFGHTPTLRVETKFNWKQALAVAVEILGEKGVTRPPFPDSSWFIKLNTVLRTHGLDEQAMRELCVYAKAKLRSPVNFDFLICQHVRILNGEFDASVTKPPAPHDLRAIREHQLPED